MAKKRAKRTEGASTRKQTGEPKSAPRTGITLRMKAWGGLGILCLMAATVPIVCSKARNQEVRARECSKTLTDIRRKLSANDIAAMDSYLEDAHRFCEPENHGEVAQLAEQVERQKASPTARIEKPRTPIILARMPGIPMHIAVDRDAVYVTSEDSSDPNIPTDIVRVPLAGGNPAVILSKQRGAQSIRVTSNAIFWIGHGDVERHIPDAIMKSQLNGGVPQRVAKTFVFGDGQLTSDAKYLYFGDYHDNSAHLMKMPIANGKVEEIAAYGSDVISVLTVDATNAYWISLSAIVKAPLSGGTVTVLVNDTGAGNVWGLASDGKHLYWTDRNNYRSDEARTGAVRRIPVDGGAIETVASRLRGRPWGIAEDATHVYWVINADSNGGIMRASKTTGAVSVVVDGQSSPVNLALDDKFVYWANAGGGHIVAKAPKEPER